ncbi:uncharacterized protein [Prorops nasuta]|uniref:uncharacterized protein n=1 Tax=Prorops nasuta TaxID=863751 RepID=UPI0034CEF95B
MDPRMIRTLTERYEKEKRFIRLQEEFVLASLTKPLTGKFYARHDAADSSNVHQRYLDFILRRDYQTPKDLYSFRPPCLNMEYGWYPTTLLPKTSDVRFHFPRRQSDFISKEIQIKKYEQKLGTEKFHGVPFVA